MTKAVIDHGDWTIAQSIFNFASNRWGSFTCDAFADNKNTKLKKYFSKHWCPGTAGIDALTQNWSNELVPPPRLGLDVLTKLKSVNGKGVLICPKWRSADFWPVLLKHFKSMYAKDFIEYQNPRNLILPGSVKSSIFTTVPFQSNVLLMLMDFSKVSKKLLKYLGVSFRISKILILRF